MNTKQIQEFIDWHENRILELNYPQKVLSELRYSRKVFLSKIIKSPLTESGV